LGMGVGEAGEAEGVVSGGACVGFQS